MSGELYLRSTLPFLSPQVTAAEARYLTEAFRALPVEGAIADLGCGHGRHACLLAESLRPRPVLGLERDPHALALRRPGFAVVRGDLRCLPFGSASLAGAYAWYASLFSLSDEEIPLALVEAARCLRPGGLLILQTVPYERVSAAPPSAFERVLPDGSRLTERSAFDPSTGRDVCRRRLEEPGGRLLSGEFSIRYYPRPHLTRLLDAAGLSVSWVHGGLDGAPVSSSSTDLIVGAEKTHG